MPSGAFGHGSQDQWLQSGATAFGSLRGEKFGGSRSARIQTEAGFPPQIHDGIPKKVLNPFYPPIKLEYPCVLRPAQLKRPKNWNKPITKCFNACVMPQFVVFAGNAVAAKAVCRIFVPYTASVLMNNQFAQLDKK